ASRGAGGRPRPSASASPRSGAIVLDGRLGDAAWAGATPITRFTQQRPVEGAPASERTEVRIVYDDEAIWIGARMFDSRGAAGVTSRLTRRDDDPQSDILRIDFDPYHDRLHSVEFDVNPAGWRGDAAGGDRSWDPVWQVASRVDSLGWSAEVRIPFSQLRFARDSVQTWGLNLTRITHRTQERALWAYWRQNEAGGPAFFGDLTGLRIHAGERHLELLPYAVTRAQRLASGDPRSPFNRPHQSDVRVGGDLKYLLTSSFTLSATVNPDFGQVEVDPAVVNLSAYESYFPEKRPFFVEGSDLFDFGSPGCNINCGLGLDLFYSRRIGRSPQGAGLAYSAGDYADVPANSSILGAAKVIGRTAGGLAVGITDALTRREMADVALPDGSFRRLPVEPLTNSFVGRAKRDLRGGNLVLGGLLTAVTRRLDDPGLASLLPRSAIAAGLDGDAYWSDHAWHLYGAITTSRLTGDSLAIARLQRSSARYFERPDRRASAGGVAPLFDPSATLLGGSGAIARLSKGSGSWIGDLNAASVSPGYETNDLGFQQKADYRWLNGTIGRQYTTPTRWFRELTWLTGAEQYWDFDGDNTGRDATGVVAGQWPNYWSTTAVLSRSFAALNDRKARGGPLLGDAAGTGGFVSVSSDPRRAVTLNLNVNGSRADDGAVDRSVGVSATVRPASNVRLTAGPGVSRSTSTDQYVTAFADPTASLFFGRRYVFSHLDQRQLYMDTRANVTFTPALSLEVYAQPLIASGHFYDFEEFAAPRTTEKRVYGRDAGTIAATTTAGRREYRIDPDGAGPAPAFTIGDPDFNFRSLRGTGVLRWEWRPGSTAYFVWTQTRSDVAPLGDLSFARDRRALLAAPADNIFVVKISYWLGR
ncbi:MAG: hypothetical protein JWN79_2362, partial [Gemmatimonadetes bacterium]|nr:hypothetical protein [Gemmatimonadota bacterium]